MNWKNQAGRLSQTFTPDQVTGFVSCMAELPCRSDGVGGKYYIISPNGTQWHHWFEHNILAPINSATGLECRLLYAELLNCAQPGDVHHDCKPLPRDAQEHCMTFLIPHSLDERTDWCPHTSTFVFDQDIGRMGPGPDQQLPELYPQPAEWVQRLSHVSAPWHHTLSVKAELDWCLGDVLWWDSALAHATNDFRSAGYSHKRSIIFFTYL